MSAYPPPPPGPQYPVDWKAQRRYDRDQLRAQRDLYRAQMRAQRRGSIVGPILVITVGVVFLLVQTDHLASARLWDWYARWWPSLLIGLGFILLLEWAVDQWLGRRAAEASGTAPALPRRTIGGGAVLLLLVLIGTGAVFTAAGRHGNRDFFAKGLNLDQDNLDEFLGDKHESDQSLTHALPADAAVSIDNPHGDITISGTSDDGQLHITAHKEVFSRSDSDADRESRKLAPQVEVTGSKATVSMPSLGGARADLTILVPSSASLAVTANHGDVRVNSIKSTVSITTNHGDTDVNGVTGPVVVHSNSSSGSVSAHKVTDTLSIEGHGHDLTVSDVGGATSINADFFGTTHLERLSGGVKYHTSRTDLKLASLTGELEISPRADLSISHASGPVVLNTRNHNITLDGLSGDLTVTNRNGSVDLTTAPPLGNVNVQNRNGSVEVTLPNKSNFAVSADTTDGDLNNDFSLAAQENDSHKSLNGTVGKGGSMIRISTSQGDVAIRKASGGPVPPSTPAPPAGSGLSIHGEDGSSVVIGKDGVKVVSGADGSAEVVGRDGLRITKNADGSSVYRGSNGTQLTENADGSKIYVGQDGIHLTENADGSKIYTARDGTRINLEASGRQTAVGRGGTVLSDSDVRDRIRRAQDDLHRAEQQRDLEQRQHQSGDR